MAEVHTSITSDKSGNQIVVHNPGQTATVVGAGVPATAAAKTVGNPNGVAHGQVPNSSVIFHNPS